MDAEVEEAPQESDDVAEFHELDDVAVAEAPEVEVRW